MRKLLYALLPSLALVGMTACDDEPDNPGDFSIKPVIELGTLRSLNTGAEYPLVVERTADTTYMYDYEHVDTILDARGNPVLDANGNVRVNRETRQRLGNTTGKLTMIEKIMLPSSMDAPRDTFELTINSNARWTVTNTNSACTWLKNFNSLSGNGDGKINFEVIISMGNVERQSTVQQIMASDSSVVICVPFGHTGLRYQPQ